MPVAEARSAEGKAAAGLLMLFEPCNGLCLTTCHDYFDADCGLSIHRALATQLWPLLR